MNIMQKSVSSGNISMYRDHSLSSGVYCFHSFTGCLQIGICTTVFGACAYLDIIMLTIQITNILCETSLLRTHAHMLPELIVASRYQRPLTEDNGTRFMSARCTALGYMKRSHMPFNYLSLDLHDSVTLLFATSDPESIHARLPQ